MSDKYKVTFDGSQYNVTVDYGLTYSGSSYFNVKSGYGAIGDGVTDDTAAIQSAIDACEAATGGTIIAPQGDYLISGEGINIRNTVYGVQTRFLAYGAHLFRNEDPDPLASSAKPIMTLGAYGEDCIGMEVRGGRYDFQWDGAAHVLGGDTFNYEQWIVPGSDCIKTINMRHSSIDDVTCRYGRVGIHMTTDGTSAHLGTGTLTATGASTVFTVASGAGDLTVGESFLIHYATTDADDDTQFATMIADTAAVITDITGSAVTTDFDSSGMTAADMDTVYWVSSTGGRGCVYNTMRSNYIVNCRSAYELESEANSAWVNENSFIGGSIGFGEYISNYSTSALEGRGIRYTPLTYHAAVMNNNRFVDISIEGAFARMVRECGVYKTSDRVGQNSYIRLRAEGLTRPLFDFGDRLGAKDLGRKYEHQLLISKINTIIDMAGMFDEDDAINPVSNLDVAAGGSNIQIDGYNRFSTRQRSAGYTPASYACVEVHLSDSETSEAFAVRDAGCNAETGIELFGNGAIWMEPQASIHPASRATKAGSIYYDSDVNKLMAYTGSSWEEVGPWDSHTNLIDTAWTDLVVSAGNLRIPPANAPTPTVWKTNLLLPAFDAAGGEYLHIEGVQAPHGYVPGTDWLWHAHFVNPTVIPDGDTVIFNLRYTVSEPYSLYPAEIALDVTFTNDAAFRALYPALVDGSDNVIADSHLLATIGTRTVDGTDLTLSSVLVGRIERNSADTFADDVLLVSSDFHIQVDRFGSENEYTG